MPISCAFGTNTALLRVYFIKGTPITGITKFFNKFEENHNEMGNP